MFPPFKKYFLTIRKMFPPFKNYFIVIQKMFPPFKTYFPAIRNMFSPFKKYFLAICLRPKNNLLPLLPPPIFFHNVQPAKFCFLDLDVFIPYRAPHAKTKQFENFRFSLFYHWLDQYIAGIGQFP